jgi:hypothetical protein
MSESLGLTSHKSGCGNGFMSIGIRPPKVSNNTVRGFAINVPTSTGTARHEASSFLTKGFLRSVSAGIGSQKGVLRSLVRSKQPVKDADPRT